MRADRRLRRVSAALLACIAAGLALNAGWIHAKAMLAQELLERAWESSRDDGQPHRPWPWADSHPVARLHAPTHGISQMVLAGDSGRTIAFAPGWAPASAAPGHAGTTVISAHRDTHFAWLKNVKPGEVVEVETLDGRRAYRIAGMRVADSRFERLNIDSYRDRLLLVTCWPFDAVIAGGPLRYVVEAEAI